MRERPLIVGAGAAGLAVAAMLARRGIRADVLERAGSVGSAWSARYDSLRLHTARRLSGLPGLVIPERYGPWVARDDVVDYLTAYAAHHGIVPEFGVEVHRIDRVDRVDGAGGRNGGRWSIRTSDGRRPASEVILATSFSNVAQLPEWAASRTGSGVPLVHSVSYRNPGPYLGRRVLVVGAGNSGSEIAVDLAAAGVEVWLSVHRPPDILRRDLHGVSSQVFGIALRRMPELVMNPLGRALRRLTVPDLGPYGLPAPTGPVFSEQRRTQTVPILDHGFVDAVRDGRIRVVPAVRALGAGPHAGIGTVEFADGSSRRPDAVICATGYRPGLEPLVGHLGVLDERGRPRAHGASTVPGAPGLYFAGIEVVLSGQLRELGIQARQVAAAIAATPRVAGTTTAGTTTAGTTTAETTTA